MAMMSIASLLPVSILIYFSAWLLGTIFSRISIECDNVVRFFPILDVRSAVNLFQTDWQKRRPGY